MTLSGFKQEIQLQTGNASHWVYSFTVLGCLLGNFSKLIFIALPSSTEDVPMHACVQDFLKGSSTCTHEGRGTLIR